MKRRGEIRGGSAEGLIHRASCSTVNIEEDSEAAGDYSARIEKESRSLHGVHSRYRLNCHNSKSKIQEAWICEDHAGPRSGYYNILWEDTHSVNFRLPKVNHTGTDSRTGDGKEYRLVTLE